MSNITNQEQYLFKALHDARITANEVFNQRAFRGVKPNVVDKYAETAHFVYELLQNADDANATEVTIILKPDRLLFKHNGTKHFDITSEDDERVGDINSITGIGNSSKENTQNKIGKFGVGFKAVFQYTDTPEIYDDPFKFKIEDLIVPTLIENDYPERFFGETLFVLPFRDPKKSFKEIEARLESLYNPLLFLRHLRKIIWQIDFGGNKGTSYSEYNKSLIEQHEFKDVKLEKYRLVNSSRIDYMFLFSRNVTININGGGKSVFPIYVGFYYDEQNKCLITKGRQNIYCFFPTKETFKSCFISHAPFLLTENRQNIKPNEELNKKLLRDLASLAKDSVLALRDYGLKKSQLLIDENIVDILPQYEEYYFHQEEKIFDVPMMDAFKDMIDYEEILLSRNGKYLTVEDAYTSTSAVLELLTQDQFVLLRQNSSETEDDDISDDIDFLKWELIMKLSKIEDDCNYYENIKDYSIGSFGYDISEVFMKAQKTEWVTKFYTFLRNDAPKYWKISPQTRATAHVFRSAPIIKLQSGEWVPPFINTTIPNVFLPIENNSRNQSEYNLISEEYLKEDMAVKFFNELELKQPDELDYIRNIILKKYDVEDGKEVDIDDKFLKTDLQFLLSYYKKVKDTSSESEFIDLLKDKIYLAGTDDCIYKASSLYLRTEFLKGFLGSEGVFFNINFYKRYIIEFKEGFINDFLSRLGAKDKPAVELKKYYNQYRVPQHIQPTIRSMRFYEFNYVSDFCLVGFEDAYKKKRLNKNVSVFLWNNVIPFYEDKVHASIYTRQKYKQYLDTKYVDSSFFFQVKTFCWLYDKEGNAKSASDIYVEDLAAEYNTYNGVIEFLGIEKRTQNLQEKYGATEEEQQTFEMGAKVAQEIDDDFSQEEALAAIRAAKAKKKQEKLQQEAEENRQKEQTLKPESLPEKAIEEPEDINEKLKKRWEEKSNRRVNKPHSSTNNDGEFNLDTLGNNNEVPENNAPFFVPVSNSQEDLLPNTEDTSRAEKNLKAKDTTAQNQAENAKEQVEILDLLKQTPTYTFKWFKVLMELMHAGQHSITERRVQIDFSHFEKICSDKILHLTEPTLPVPAWICDAEKYSVTAISEGKSSKIDGLIVKTSDDSIDLSIEDNNSNFSSILYAKKIRIIAIDNTNIIDSLETRFLQLAKDDDFDMNANLPKNIEFIYGPPGTGKTTELVKQVHDVLEKEPKAKILVLTPTNKAADVVAIKMANDTVCEGGLARYGATESLYLIEDIGCVTNRDTTDMEGWHNIVVATAARYAYDFVQPDDTPICDYPWDYIFIDEASMIDILTITYILYKGANAKKIIISGDPKQIQPVVQNDMPAYNIYDMVNLHEFADALFNYDRYPVKGLMTQHRSVPTIGDFVSKFAYGGLVDADPDRSPQKPLKLDGLRIADVNFVGFDVAEFDDIRGLCSVGQSAFNLYSAIFTYNMIEYTIKQIEKNHPDMEYSIGVVCAYRAQSDAIKNMLENRPLDTSYCKVTSGTVHSFQGDECDIMFIVLNPPANCTSGAHVNNENIINVAISRARDYIFFVLPNGQQQGFTMKNRIGSVIPFTERTVMKCRDVEKVMFHGNENYIYENTHVTCHMPVNVYCEENALYEVRMSEDALDIKINQ